MDSGQLKRVRVKQRMKDRMAWERLTDNTAEVGT